MQRNYIVQDFFKRRFQLPENWTYPSFSTVVLINPKTKFDTKDVAYVPMDAVNVNSGSIDYVERRNLIENSSLPKFQRNDILFARITPCIENGKIGISENLENGIASSELIVLRPTEKVIPKYLFYYVKSHRIKEFAVSQMMGTTGRQRVPDNVFKKYLNFELPTIHEQQKIASILSNVDELIQKTDQIIAQTQRIKKGLMERILTKGIGHTKFKDIFMGTKSIKLSIPQEWKVQPLDKIARVIDVRHSTPHYTKDGYPLILPNNVKIEGLNLLNTKFTNEKDYLYMIEGDRKPESGDIIYSRNASFGIACKVETNTKFSLGQDLVLIKPEKINSYLLYLILNSTVVTRQLTRLSTGSTFQRINLELIRNFLIPCSNDLKEEDEIAIYIQNFEKMIENLIHRLERLNSVKKGLMQQLLTGKIRVKI